jgi:hypothetical protein
MRLLDGGRSSIYTIGTVRVSEVKFLSTRLNTLSASLDGSSPVDFGPPVVAGAAPG